MDMGTFFDLTDVCLNASIDEAIDDFRKTTGWSYREMMNSIFMGDLYKHPMSRTDIFGTDEPVIIAAITFYHEDDHAMYCRSYINERVEVLSKHYHVLYDELLEIHHKQYPNTRHYLPAIDESNDIRWYFIKYIHTMNNQYIHEKLKHTVTPHYAHLKMPWFEYIRIKSILQPYNEIHQEMKEKQRVIDQGIVGDPLDDHDWQPRMSNNMPIVPYNDVYDNNKQRRCLGLPELSYI